ncbi:unnamed protein product [Closterium sp. Naga37s-1]|nr:unnamed protein product [Closterium sp. Naga37s-1]
MVTHKDWEEKGRKQQTGRNFEMSVLDVEWWKKVDTFVKVMELPYKVMRKTDGPAKGMMGAMYDIMLQLTEDLSALLESADCQLSEEDKEGLQEHLRRRWDESMACPLHVVGRILNLVNQEEGIYLKDVECTRVMKAWLSRSRAFVDKYWKKDGETTGTMMALQEGMLAYIEGRGCFGSEEAIEGRALGSEKVRDLVFVAHNWKVVHGHHQGAAVAGPSGEVRKAGVVEGNIPTPPLPEGYMLEEDGEREVDEDDMMVDEGELCGGGQLRPVRLAAVGGAQCGALPAVPPQVHPLTRGDAVCAAAEPAAGAASGGEAGGGGGGAEGGGGGEAGEGRGVGAGHSEERTHGAPCAPRCHHRGGGTVHGS